MMLSDVYLSLSVWRMSVCCIHRA